MSGAFLSMLGGWWHRQFGRKRPARPAPAEGRSSPERRRTPAMAAAAAVAIAPGKGARAKSSPVALGAAIRPRGAPAAAELQGEAQATRSLIETLGLSELPVAAQAVATDRDAVRARTLEALGNLRQIPALQSLAQGFMRTMGRSEVAVEEVVAAIEKDSALCVRILRMANSVLVSSERRIEDLDTAVQMLGVARVRTAAQALFTLRDANRVAEGFDWKHLWVHALATAAIAEELEQQLRGADDSQVYLAGLLHDVGKIVLSTIAPEDYRGVLVTAWQENGRLEDLERERLGVDHREAGVAFAELNGLPPVVVAAIAHHHRPQEAAGGQSFDVALVTVANYLSKAHGLGFSGARLDASDGEFEHLAAWDVMAATLGRRPDPVAIEAEMGAFIGTLRGELRGLRDGI